MIRFVVLLVVHLVSAAAGGTTVCCLQDVDLSQYKHVVDFKDVLNYYYPEAFHLTNAKDVVEISADVYRLYTGDQIKSEKYYLVKVKKRFGSNGKHALYFDGKSSVLSTHYGLGGDTTIVDGVVVIRMEQPISVVKYIVR